MVNPTHNPHRKWISDAYHYWDEIRKTADAAEAGVAQLSGYIFSSIDPGIVRVSASFFPFFASFAQNFHPSHFLLNIPPEMIIHPGFGIV